MQPLRITVYDKARLASDVENFVEKGVRRLFCAAGIDVKWIVGDLMSPDATSVQWVAQVKVDVQLRQDVVLDILPDSPRALDLQILGRANPFAEAGLNVRIYCDHVRNSSINNSHLLSGP